MSRTQKIKQLHLHMLLWNLRAHRSNLVNAPAGLLGATWREAARKRIPEYEAELVRRGAPLPPENTTETQWEALLASALESK